MSSADRVDQALTELLRPSGDAGARHARAEALTELLDHADEAHPRLLALASVDEPPVLVLAALPHFGRAESIPVLERALRHASAPTTVTAAYGLAAHPSGAAREALERALRDDRAQVVASAAAGLAERADPVSRDALQAALGHADPEVRERVEQALDRLSCKRT